MGTETRLNKVSTKNVKLFMLVKKIIPLMGTETNKSSITLLIVSPLYVKKIIPLMGTETS